MAKRDDEPTPLRVALALSSILAMVVGFLAEWENVLAAGFGIWAFAVLKDSIFLNLSD